MASHASWKGHLKISLASIPVQAYTAAAGKDNSEISLHQLHETCGSRIQYKKFCPIHGEVTQAEIVSGYEYAKGQYAILDRDEMAELAAAMEKSLAIDAFVAPDAIDPTYSAGQTYYLVPDGREGDKPYALIRESLLDEELHGVGEIVIAKKQHLVRLRPTEKLLVLDILHYEGEIRPPTKYANEIRAASVSSPELKMTKALVEQLTQPDFDISQYADDYMERMKDLIEIKLKGKKLPVPETEEEEPDVINFMDALKRSVKLAQSPREATPAKKAHSKSHATTRARSVARRTKPKTG